jgi:hypothetical protein
MTLQIAETFPSVAYLVIAYAFAVAALGGYLFWSLRHLRALTGKQ